MQDEGRFTDSQTEEGRYRLLVGAITDYAIYMLDPDGVVSSWNAGAERFMGYTADEIIGQHFSRFYTKEDLAEDQPALALRIAAKEGRLEREGWRVRKDGARFWAHVVIDAIRDPAGGLVGFAKITRDLTERRSAAEALRRSEQQFRLLVQGVVDYAIFMLDREGHVVSWNAGAQRIKGYLPEEIIGRHFSQFYVDEDRRAGLPDRGLALAASEGRWETEGWRIRKDGTRFWAHIVIDAIRGDDGEVVGFAKITRDVTERMEAAKSLEAAREALFQSQKMEAVGQLTGGVAHDFNNLLTVIIGGLDTIHRTSSTDSERASRALDMARHASERAASLTARLLAFSRRQALAPSPTNVSVLVRDMTELLHRALGEMIELEGVLTPRPWPIEVDRNQLESALLNLAVNARDAMPNGGKLTIETSNTFLDEADIARDAEVVPGPYTVVSIADTGAGMPKAVLDRVFEPFFTTKDMGKGTGLGLSMVYGFVKQSGGHITLDSEVGVGTKVKLFFPRYAGAKDLETNGSAPAAPTSGRGEVVLVVEDNDDVRTYSVTSLTELGYEVIEAREAEAALDFIKTDRRIDLLFTDMVMPGKSGRVLADEARAIRPELKVLFTTGYSRNAIVHNGRLDAGVQLISKPFTFDLLAAKVRDAIDRPVAAPANS